jgi:hypothetical protein
MAGHIRYITPIYGNGWVCADGQGREVPEPFRLGCSDPDAERGIVLGNHEFSEATAHLSARHETQDGCFNLAISRDGVLLASGYAQA